MPQQRLTFDRTFDRTASFFASAPVIEYWASSGSETLLWQGSRSLQKSSVFRTAGSPIFNYGRGSNKTSGSVNYLGLTGTTWYLNWLQNFTGAQSSKLWLGKS